jgi:hypothetical protein
LNAVTLEEFEQTLSGSSPPRTVSKLLEALWQERKGDWAMAHQLAQSVGGVDGALVHAYLHRKEGDESNALYWYSRARRDKPQVALEQEWENIVKELLNKD